MSASEYGTLWVVSTPIGNLKDVSFRALEIFKNVHCIVCEDTRVTLKLLNYYKIKKHLLSYHSKSRDPDIRRIENALLSGKDVALVTDRGTPCVSDPGNTLIARMVGHGIRVVPVPGPSAVHTALAASGILFSEYMFIGFLSSKRSRRRKRLQELYDRKIVFVFFESPHRIVGFLQDVIEILGTVKVVVGKEMTKRFEKYYRGSVEDVADMIQQDGVKGEYTVVVDNREKKL